MQATSPKVILRDQLAEPAPCVPLAEHEGSVNMQLGVGRKDSKPEIQLLTVNLSMS